MLRELGFDALDNASFALLFRHIDGLESEDGVLRISELEEFFRGVKRGRPLPPALTETDDERRQRLGLMSPEEEVAAKAAAEALEKQRLELEAAAERQRQLDAARVQRDADEKQTNEYMQRTEAENAKRYQKMLAAALALLPPTYPSVVPPPPPGPQNKRPAWKSYVRPRGERAGIRSMEFNARPLDGRTATSVAWPQHGEVYADVKAYAAAALKASTSTNPGTPIRAARAPPPRPQQTQQQQLPVSTAAAPASVADAAAASAGEEEAEEARDGVFSMTELAPQDGAPKPAAHRPAPTAPAHRQAPQRPFSAQPSRSPAAAHIAQRPASAKSALTHGQAAPPPRKKMGGASCHEVLTPNHPPIPPPRPLDNYGAKLVLLMVRRIGVNLYSFAKLDPATNRPIPNGPLLQPPRGSINDADSAKAAVEKLATMFADELPSRLPFNGIAPTSLAAQITGEANARPVRHMQRTAAGMLLVEGQSIGEQCRRDAFYRQVPPCPLPISNGHLMRKPPRPHSAPVTQYEPHHFGRNLGAPSAGQRNREEDIVNIK